MNNFVVSARKHRPAVFDRVVGQSHVTVTLKNAVRDNHLAQAFLFCGPRGVGKTTCARILAKTINCQQLNKNIESCNTCTSCASFNSNRSLNIYEIDAASNNSVEDIRSLVEQVRYPPQTGKYKVYIIDEVHMLSNAAFNTFLKTLEEPPGYVIFILATTEKHKVIPTILSRCQIFDFYRIQPQVIMEQLKYIAQQENIAYEEEALHLISQKADGALRDALSIFDLIVTFASGNSVSCQATREHLHILDHAFYFRLTTACLEGDPGATLLIYDEILKVGFDGQHFITGLSDHFRNLMICHNAAALPLLAVADNIKEQYKAQATHAGLTFLFKALNITNQCDIQYKSSNNKRLHVEIALIELASIVQRENSLAGSAESPHVYQPSNPPHDAPTLEAASVSSLVQEKKKISVEDRATNSVSRLSNESGNLQTTVKLPQIDQLKKKISQQKVPSLSQPLAQVAPPPLITKEVVHKHWHVYANKLKTTGKMSEYSLLNQDIFLTRNTIVIQLVNTVQQDILARIQEDLMTYLRQALQCPALELKGVLAPPEKNIKPYTAQERFRYLAEKHPHLRLLREKLLLEVQD